MTIESPIFSVLAEAGDRGLHVAKISRHVFNATNTLFNPCDLTLIHEEVKAYLAKNSKGYDSIFERVGRGVYKLNPHSAKAAQLLLQFADDPGEQNQPPPPPDERQLMLF